MNCSEVLFEEKERKADLITIKTKKTKWHLPQWPLCLTYMLVWSWQEANRRWHELEYETLSLPQTISLLWLSQSLLHSQNASFLSLSKKHSDPKEQFSERQISSWWRKSIKMYYIKLLDQFCNIKRGPPNIASNMSHLLL